MFVFDDILTINRLILEVKKVAKTGVSPPAMVFLWRLREKWDNILRNRKYVVPLRRNLN